ncbi:hypothetical protein [Limosilactobacillus sp.]|uniref:hypothetical protein n=1 Tax=Limosilactobacillus sp. TaxID=2773925 RepID=UPI00345E1CF3
MSFELVYIAKSGNKSYWTSKHNFSKKAANHFQWPNVDDIDLAKLASTYPTIFRNKNQKRFKVLNTASMQIVPLSDQQQSEAPVSNRPHVNITKSIEKKIQTDGKEFVIVTVVDQAFQYLDTTMGNHGDFVSSLNKQTKRWDDVNKAIKTAESLYKNNKFWKDCDNFEEKLLYVLNAKTDTIIWSSDNPEVQLTPTSQLLANLAELNAQLTEHFKADNNRNRDCATAKIMPIVDLNGITAEKVFASLAFLIKALTYQEKIAQLLTYYDKRVIQDQLHTAELADLQHFDASKFVRSLQASRQNCRRIKDLSVILNCLAENMDSESIITSLRNHPSLHNHYCYRDQETAKIMETLEK